MDSLKEPNLPLPLSQWLLTAAIFLAALCLGRELLTLLALARLGIRTDTVRPSLAAGLVVVASLGPLLARVSVQSGAALRDRLVYRQQAVSRGRSEPAAT